MFWRVAIVLVLLMLLLLLACAVWVRRHNRLFPGRLPASSEMRAALTRLRTEGTLLRAGDQYALVLAGGGGKGAYQIGALRALRRFGVSRFDPIAGTSVGALNGVLVAQNDLPAAARIWRQLGIWEVLTPTLTLPLAVAARVLLLPFLLLRYPKMKERGSQRDALQIPPQSWKSGILMALWLPIRSLGMLLLLVRDLDIPSRLLRFEARLGHWSASRRGRQEFLKACVRWGVPVLLLAGLSAVLALLIQLVSPAQSFGEVFGEMMAVGGADPTVLPAVGAFFTLALLGYALMVWSRLAWLHNLLMDQLSLLSNRPLRKLVNREVNKERLDLAALENVFVTVASRGVRWTLRDTEVRAFSVERRAAAPPERVANDDEQENGSGRLRSWWQRHVGARKDFGRDPSSVSTLVVSRIERPVEEAVFVATYQNLRWIGDAEEIRRFVVQSAGLPEIFPRRSVGGRPAVDGGVADNLPLTPVLQRGDDATIVVIDLCKPVEENLWLSAIRQRLEIRYRSLESDVYTYLMKDAQNRKQVASSLRGRNDRISSRKVAVLAIRPSIDLGNMVTGTMNFSRRKARALMWLGYSDALAALRRGPIELVHPVVVDGGTARPRNRGPSLHSLAR